MADPDVLKRLEEIEQEFLAQPEMVDDFTMERSRFWWLLRLTRALLESQGECPRCKVLARAEKVRKGEV